MNKYDEQLALEAECIGLGVARYRKERPLPWQKTAGHRKNESDLSPGKTLLKRMIEPVADLISSTIKESQKKGKQAAGRNHRGVEYLSVASPSQLAFLACRHTLNGASSARSLQSVTIALGDSVQNHVDFSNMVATDSGLARKLEKQLKSTSHEGHRKAVLNHTMTKFDIDKLGWSKEDKLRLGMKLVEIVCDSTGLFFTEKVRMSPASKKYIFKIFMTDKLKEWMDKQHSRCELMNPMYLPMVCPPRPWTTPYSGGYLKMAKHIKLVKTHNRAYLDELGSIEMPDVYSAVNAIQSVSWRINNKVLKVIEEVWEEGGGLGGLPSAEDTPVPTKPADIDTNEESLTAWKREASAIYSSNARNRAKRLKATQVLWIAGRFADEESIYFPHNIDFRGRVYPIPTFINPQGDDITKSLLEFSAGKPIGAHGAFYLGVHLANLFGVDKCALAERVSWVMENEEAILDSARSPLDGQRFWATADEPWSALAACYEWAGYVEQGEDWVTHLPCHADGSCSGLQHFSGMLRDERGGRAVNLIPAETPQDFYSDTAAVAQEIVDASIKEDSLPWKGGKITRKIAKQPCMTYCYSATRFGMQEMIYRKLEDIDEENKLAGKSPHLEGADNYSSSVYLSHVMYDSISKVVTSASEAMSWLREAAKVASEAGLPIYWSSPIGFPVLQEYKDWQTKRENVWLNGRRTKLQLRLEGSKISKVRQTNGIAPNFIHAADGAHLMSTVNHVNRLGVSDVAVIHDSFATHASSMHTLGTSLRSAFVDQYSGDVLNDFREQLIEQIPRELAEMVPPLPSKGSMDLSVVLNSDFIFA